MTPEHDQLATMIQTHNAQYKNRPENRLDVAQKQLANARQELALVCSLRDQEQAKLTQERNAHSALYYKLRQEKTEGRERRRVFLKLRSSVKQHQKTLERKERLLAETIQTLQDQLDHHKEQEQAALLAHTERMALYKSDTTITKDLLRYLLDHKVSLRVIAQLFHVSRTTILNLKKSLL